MYFVKKSNINKYKKKNVVSIENDIVHEILL